MESVAHCPMITNQKVRAIHVLRHGPRVAAFACFPTSLRPRK